MNYYKGGLKGDLQSRLKFTYQLMNQTSILKEHYVDHYRVAHKWMNSIIHQLHQLDRAEQSCSKGSQLKESHSPMQKAEALFYLGLMYEHGFGVERSHKQSFNYFTEASDLGYAAAKNKVGDCYFSGYGVREDRKLAIGCYL
jgi:TPR repeat protein